MADELLIACLETVSEELSKEVQEKRKWGHFGNSFGEAKSKRFLIACSEILRTIAEAI